MMREAVEEAPEQKASSSMCARHLKTWGSPCKDALLRKLGLIAVNNLKKPKQGKTYGSFDPFGIFFGSTKYRTKI